MIFETLEQLKAYADEQVRKYREAQGLGDIVETTIQAVGLDALAPKGCGCKQRKQKLNELFPIGDKDGNQ
jgi:hypothetical protein